MAYFKAEMYQIWFRLGLRPRSRWGSLQGGRGSTTSQSYFDHVY